MVGPPARAVHVDQQPHRSFESDSVSYACDHLGTGTCGPPLGLTGRDADWLDRTGRAYRHMVLPQRIVDQAKARSNARDTGEVPGCLPTELNSTIAEEMKVSATDNGDSRKAC